MKQIKLTQGKFTLVDDEDFEFLNQWKWCTEQKRGTCYAVKGIREKRTNSGVPGKQKAIRMHRLIMNVNDRHIFIDHKDGNGINNQKSNLRICTHAENLRNRKPKRNGTSKYLGVAKIKIAEKYIYWQPRICYNKKNIHLGCFPYTKEGEINAARAYNKKAKELHGEFARLNVV